jgi:signal transduction histidine kinase
MKKFFDALYAAGHKSFDLKIERLIALLRIALTAFCFVSFNASLKLPQSQYAAPFESILATYALFGVFVALLPTFSRYRTGWQLPVHIVDVGVVAILMNFSLNVSAVFFILYVFVLMAATFRWNWRGALWTTLALPVLQLTLIPLSFLVAAQFIIQWCFLIIVGGMFVFFGVSRERSFERLTRLADWPDNRGQLYTNIDEHWLDTGLKHIAAVFQAPRILVLWEITQEPYCYSALFANGKCQYDRTMDITFASLVPVELGSATFATASVKSNECLTLSGIKHFAEPPVNESIQTRFDISSVCSAQFTGEYCKGRVFILDRSHWIDDDLTMTEIVASRLHLELEYFALSIELKESAASRERIRLAHDLHDGVLQTLTGAALQLSSVGSRSGQDVKHNLARVRELLLGEQQRIRAFVEEHRPSLRLQHLNLHDAIKREIERIQHRWDCNVLLSVTPQDATAHLELTRQIELLLAEAAANAVQHGNASQINITVDWAPNNVRLCIADNGRGLSNITGTYSQDQIATGVIGPQSISKRIIELGGTLSLSTSCKGLELCIELPCNRMAKNVNEPV